MKSYFTHIHHGDPEEAAEIGLGRFGYLVSRADLSAFSFEQFRTMCQLLNGILTDDWIDGRAYLIEAVADELQNVGRVLPASRASELAIIRDLLQKLDLTAGLALLVRIEEVYAESRADMDIEISCRDVYAKMQTRQFL